MSSKQTWEFHQCAGGPSGQWWELRVDDYAPVHLYDATVTDVLRSVETAILNGHIVRIHTLMEEVTP